MKFLIGKKLGMTTLFDAEKGALNMTLITCEKNTVTLKRTPEKNGYSALQVEAPKNKKKSVRREFRLDKDSTSTDDTVTLLEGFTEGSELSVDQFEVGDKVHVSGITKAKGFQGVVKRHGFPRCSRKPWSQA
ncbi:MAG: 50S ribosomal protein L3 [Candidatus Moraniibacteriota bacterium]